MKTLMIIVLLIVSLPMVGQMKIDTATNGSLFFSYKQPIDSFIEYSPNMWWNEATWVIIDSTSWYRNIDQMLYLYDEYQRYCHNDSTKSEAAVYITYDDGRVIGKRPEPWEMIMNYEKDTIVYYHKQPTFKGFMEFLKTKIK